MLCISSTTFIGEDSLNNGDVPISTEKVYLAAWFVLIFDRPCIDSLSVGFLLILPDAAAIISDLYYYEGELTMVLFY